MPSIHTVERFVAMVEAGQGLEALRQFYAEHASIQENNAPPRVGKQALLECEQAAQASVANLKASCVRPILVSGSVTVIRWVFEYDSLDGGPVRFEELAYQVWDDERVVREQFFYDPAQFKQQHPALPVAGAA